MRNKRWTVEEIELLKTKWTKTKTEELKILFPGRSYNSLLQKAVELGIRMEKGFRKRKGNLIFLDTLSRESVYWWGLILADGHISKQNEVSIYLHKDDEEYLKVLTNKLNVKIRYSKEMCYFTIGDKDFSERWKKQLKMNDECTKTYCPPCLDIFKNYMMPLFIGLIDGDGHIRFGNGYYNCSIDLYNTWFSSLEIFQKVLSFYGIKASVKYTKKGKYCRLNIVGKENLIKLLPHLQGLPYLQRKWNKILQSP